MQSLSFNASKSVSCKPSRSSLIHRIIAAFALARSRKQLAALDAQQLDDIGINKSDAKIEANRPIWDVPANWIK